MANLSTEEAKHKDIPVRVAVRIRPLVSRETREACQECLDVSNGTQVIVRGTDKAFTFDYAFPSDTTQSYVYDKSVAKMVKQLFKGYNVTILAYGQTGSGKTYSMGTAYMDMNENETGIIPRAVKDIFTGIAERPGDEIIVRVSFIELYKETLYDLLNTKTREETIVDIREDPRGGIKITGLTEIPVNSLEETMKCLEHGAMNRATGATAMNARSSRSHAIFSLHIELRNKEQSENIISAKFHLVDLAGSERAKKTGATGERFKEGVNINKGLLALGNVISALCGEGGHRGHIPYRDSKLTRLLQDSLGGNSHTVMLACVSPADSNLEETLSTLRYADRARKIKNKPIINRDPQAAELATLRQQVQQLQVQLLASQSCPGGTVITNTTELNGLLSQIHALEEENDKLMRALQSALEENTNMAEKALMAEMARDRFKTRLEELRSQTGNTVDVLNKTFEVTGYPQFEEQITLVKGLQKKIIDLQAEQRKSERAIVDHELYRHSSTTISSPKNGSQENDESEELEAHSPIKGDFGAAYTLRQAKLNEELQGLNRALAMKEELMTKMSANDDRFVVMKSTYEKSLKGFEEQINDLIKEKDQLNQKLRNENDRSASNKIAEQRRKRLQELESLIAGLKKKINEQNKLLKIKEQSEQKVKTLISEIQSMKSIRVKLIRQMKEDGDKFRQWKAQKDREVAKLKEADRKKQFQIVKMERMHTKQQNVLKRKMEEAVAINKRLKDAMALQKDCQERRNASRDVGSVSSRMKTWLEGELEVVTAKKQVKQSLGTLIVDRKTISEQLNKVKAQLSRGEFSDAMEKELRIKKDNLEKDLQLRTAQINDMQLKIVEEDGESTSKKRFDFVQTMVEAKCAMQHLFEVATENLSSVAQHESDIKELNSQYEDVCNNLEELEAELTNLKEQHQTELSRISREHEDKILFLLRQMPKTEDVDMKDVVDEGNECNSEDSAIIERLKFQEKELARLSNLHDLLQQKTVECEELKKQLQEQAKPATLNVEAKSFLFPRQKLVNKKSSADVVKPLKKSEGFVLVSSDEEEDHEEEVESEEEEKLNDPDWRKTPLFKRIRQITSRGKQVRESSSSDSPEEDKIVLGTKRNSSGEIKCGCSKDCSSKLCKCRKHGNGCCVSCKCNAMICVNRNTPNSSVSSSNASRGDTLLNSTFDVSLKQQQPPLAENISSKKMKISDNPKQRNREDISNKREDENMDPLFAPLTVDITNMTMPPLL